MSSLVMFGFFCVSGSCQVPSLKAGSMSKSAYTCYNATIHASTGGSLRTQIIMGSSLDDVVIANHTIVFMVGKAYLPPTTACEQALLEATFFIPLPGDPSCDAYEFVLPQWTAPFIIGLGCVALSFITPTDGQNSSVSVVCSDYIWDSKMSSKLIFDDNLLPAYHISSFPQNSLIQFFSLIKDVVSGGRMTVDVQSIVTDMDQTSQSLILHYGLVLASNSKQASKVTMPPMLVRIILELGAASLSSAYSSRGPATPGKLNISSVS
ncbi:hypothetical protein EV401DRAFT_2079356 [Pisolithus croceorrhizus]|nr:hypothetical protein EV401DRAFT_2079356 [Pisolithus croceorrhizus]